MPSIASVTCCGSELPAAVDWRDGQRPRQPNGRGGCAAACCVRTARRNIRGGRADRGRVLSARGLATGSGETGSSPSLPAGRPRSASPGSRPACTPSWRCLRRRERRTFWPRPPGAGWPCMAWAAVARVSRLTNRPSSSGTRPRPDTPTPLPLPGCPPPPRGAPNGPSGLVLGARIARGAEGTRGAARLTQQERLD